MGNIYEDPTLAILCGVLAELVLGIVLWQTGRGVLLWFMAGVAGLVLLGIVVERLVITPRERITVMLDDARRRVAANDQEGVLRFVAPQAKEERQLVSDAMRRWKFKDVEIRGLEIEIEPGSDPSRAEARMIALFSFRDQRGEFSGENFLTRVQLKLTREGDRWLVLRLLEADRFQP